MIVFSGKIKDTIQRYIVNLRSRQTGIMISFLGVIGMITTFLFWIIDKTFDRDIFKILILSCITVITGGILFIPVKSRNLRIHWDYHIKFENGTITISSMHQNGIVKTKPFKKIKKIIDYGDYYYLYVFRLDASHGIVCQKDLLIEGTIEEFEKLFEGKIKRKTKKA